MLLPTNTLVAHYDFEVIVMTKLTLFEKSFKCEQSSLQIIGFGRF